MNTGFTDQALFIHCSVKKFVTVWHVFLLLDVLEYINQGEEEAVLNFHVTCLE